MVQELASQGDPTLQYNQPRLVISSMAYNNAKQCSGWDPASPQNTTWAYQPGRQGQNSLVCANSVGNCGNYHCDIGSTGTLYVIDTNKYAPPFLSFLV